MTFEQRLEWLKAEHEALITKKNEPIEGNGVYERYKNPIITNEHAPLFWRYDLNKETNPYLMERFGINATLNSGAIKWNGKYVLVVRVEAADRKSFFAVAESPNGIDNFKFWDRPITMPEYVSLQPMCMICDLLHMRTAGSTVSSAWSARIRMPLQEISLQQLPLPVSPVQRIS